MADININVDFYMERILEAARVAAADITEAAQAWKAAASAAQERAEDPERSLDERLLVLLDMLAAQDARLKKLEAAPAAPSEALATARTCAICGQPILQGQEDEVGGRYHQLCCDLYAPIADVLREHGDASLADVAARDALADAIVRRLRKVEG